VRRILWQLNMIGHPLASIKQLMMSVCELGHTMPSERSHGCLAQVSDVFPTATEFWIAALRGTMRAIEAGLLSVDCLKASHTSVHAAGGAVR
jgi:hypothetical protein